MVEKMKDIGGSALGALAAFSILNIPTITEVAVWQKVLAMSILGITMIALWGRNKF